MDPIATIRTNAAGLAAARDRTASMDDIDGIPAGGDLDRLVANKVMAFDDDVDYLPPHGRWHRRPDGRDDWFAPSTNIAHAWEVLDRLIALGLWPSVNRLVGSEEWATIIVGKPFLSDPVTAYGPTAPLAICRAALIAVSK